MPPHNADLHNADPYIAPSYSLRNRIFRFTWGIVYAVLFRPSLRPMHGWRRMVLRAFGAKLGAGCRIYAKARIWAPWNLICEDVVLVADGAEIYNPKPIRLGSHAIVSQDAYLCGATHDYEDPAFPVIAFEMSVGSYAWVCSRATVQPGVSMGEGAVLALGSVATRNLEPWSVYAGIPARKIKDRVMRQAAGASAAAAPRGSHCIS